jgi:hypothetical protein
MDRCPPLPLPMPARLSSHQIKQQHYRSMFSSTMKGFVSREATGVYIWSLIACVIRICLSLLVSLSTLQSKENYEDETTSADMIWRYWAHQLMTATISFISVLASWVLAILPPKVATHNAPGFTFGSTWILYPLNDKFGFIPNLPCRICEMSMGRLSLRQLAIILPIHFLVPAAALGMMQIVLPTKLFSSYALEPVIYSEKSLWVVDVVRETLVNALFTVGLLVIPELLRINGIRRGFALLILYPIYSFSVDAEGKASVFGPNLIYALSCVSKHEEVPLAQVSHLLGPMLGGILGGKIMANAFPDDK